MLREAVHSIGCLLRVGVGALPFELAQLLLTWKKLLLDDPTLLSFLLFITMAGFTGMGRFPCVHVVQAAAAQALAVAGTAITFVWTLRKHDVPSTALPAVPCSGGTGPCVVG